MGVLLMMAFTVLYPVILLLINSFVTSNPGAPIEYGLAGWNRALTDRGILDSLLNTFTVFLARNGIGFPIAILIAWLIARTNMPGGRWLEFLFWVSFFMPNLSVTQAWILLLHPSAGLLNQGLEKLPFIDQGPFNIF